jgi:SAM-dependent methyltransferase
VNGRGGNAKLSALEPSVLATQIGAENYAAVELIGTDIDDLQSVSGTFDLIILSHVLEHLQHPVIALRLLASKLAKNGMLFIEVPNYYGHLSVEYAHNYLFTERSLRNALICAGLRVTAFDTRYRVRRVPMYLTTLVDREPSNPAIQKKPLLEYESPQTIRLKRAIGRMFARTYGTWTAIRRAIRI